MQSPENLDTSNEWLYNIASPGKLGRNLWCRSESERYKCELTVEEYEEIKREIKKQEAKLKS